MIISLITSLMIDAANKYQVKARLNTFCEKHLIADDPLDPLTPDEQKLWEELRRLETEQRAKGLKENGE